MMDAPVVILLTIAVGLIAFVFATTDWRRVFSILHRGADWSTSEPDRWRRVHLDADRRQPFGERERR